MALKDAADLLDHEEFADRFLRQDMAPYGLELWPSSLMLAEDILKGEPGRDRSAIELGCGLGLTAMAAARKGWRVVATDHDPTSLAFAKHNVGLSDIAIEAFEKLDWRHFADRAGRHTAAPALGTARYARVFGADVLYQLVDHEPILQCIKALLATDGVALIADPHRGAADRFDAMAKAHGFEVTITSSSAPRASGETVQCRIFNLRCTDVP